MQQQMALSDQEKAKAPRTHWGWQRWLGVTFVLFVVGLLTHEAILPSIDKTAPLLRDPIWYLLIYAPLASTLFQIGHLLGEHLKDRSEALSEAAREALSGLAMGYLFSGVTYLYFVPLYALLAGLGSYLGLHRWRSRKPAPEL